MSLRNRGGKWHFRFNLDGREYSGATDWDATERNRRKAQDEEAAYRQALKEGRNPERRVVIRQFSDAAKEFLEWAQVQYREHPNTARRLGVSFTSAIEFFGNKPVSMINAGSIERYKVHRITNHMVRDITLRHDLHALSTFFKYGVKQKWARHNPVAEVDIPSDAAATREHIVTPKEEKEYFLRAAKYPDLHDVGRLIFNRGMRPEEVTTLSKKDVDLERGQVTIRGGKSKAARRTLTLTAESKSILGQRLFNESPQWIFPSKRNPAKPISRVNSLHDKVLAIARKDGIKLGFVPYDLRHTFATRAAMAGIDIATLAALLGHGSLRTVMRYIHIGQEHQKAAMFTIERTMSADQGRTQ